MNGHVIPLRAALDVCECGDYRSQHDNGSGPCRLCVGKRQGWPRCQRFRLAKRAK